MCELCGGTPNDRKMAAEGITRLAYNLEKLAGEYRLLAFGKIKPHSDEWKKVAPLGRSVLRALFEDWV